MGNRRAELIGLSKSRVDFRGKGIRAWSDHKLVQSWRSTGDPGLKQKYAKELSRRIKRGRNISLGNSVYKGPVCEGGGTFEGSCAQW